MRELLEDVRFSFRSLLRRPGFTGVALLTLGLGIGANAAIFSVVDGVLLEPLPFRSPDELMRVYTDIDGYLLWANSPPNYLELAGATDIFAAVASYRTQQTALTGAGDPVLLDRAVVSANFFELLGRGAALGRTFAADEDDPSAARVAVLSSSLWRERFGADADVVGQDVILDGEPYRVVGVMPRGFDYPERPGLWTPERVDAGFRDDAARGALYLNVLARRAPGVSAEQARAAVRTMGQSIRERFPGAFGRFALAAVPLHEAMVGDVRMPLLVLLGAVSLVLLIACANVVNLVLARSTGRRTELAVRSALGASRWRVVRLLLVESVLLGVAGCVLGLIIAAWGVDALLTLQPGDLPRAAAVTVDGTVVAFAAGVAVLAGVLFGSVPALRVGRWDLATTLRRGAAAVGGGRSKLQSGLVVAQLALAVVLLSGAGLLLRSFGELTSVEPGFRVGDALTFAVQLPASRYEDRGRVALFSRGLAERLAAIPGSRGAVGASILPMTGGQMRVGMLVQGRENDTSTRDLSVSVRIVTPDFFSTLGIPLRRGRLLEPTDREGAPPAVLLNETAARLYFPDDDPLGTAVGLTWTLDDDQVWGRVVGVVGDVQESLEGAPEPTIYLPHAQVPVRGMTWVVPAAMDPAALAGSVRDAVRSMDPNLPLGQLRTFHEVVGSSIARPRFYTVLLALFAGVALTLAAVGIFGVLSYLVARRRWEIGVRMALGAAGATVLREIVGRALRLAALGLVLGLAGALALNRLLAGLLFHVSTTDPLTLVGVVLVLAGTATAAAYLPARSAARTDPLTALRGE